MNAKLPHLSDRDIKVLNKHTKSIINQLLKDPILQAKELAARPDADEALDLFMKIFNIEELVEKQQTKAAETNKTMVQVPAGFFSVIEVLIMYDFYMTRLHELTVVIYALSVLLYFFDFIHHNRKANRIAFWLLAFVWVLQTIFSNFLYDKNRKISGR